MTLQQKLEFFDWLQTEGHSNEGHALNGVLWS